jgi:hypothetical protein
LDYGITITGLQIHDIQGIPENVRMIGLELPPGDQVRLVRLHDLLDPTAERLQLPAGTIAIAEINGELRPLRSGSLSNYQNVPPYQEVALIDKREFEAVQVSHKFPIILPIGHGEAPLDFSVDTAISCSADTRNLDDPQLLEKLKSLWPSREKYEKWIEGRTKGAIKRACSEEGLALVQRDRQSLENVIARLLTPDLEEKGLVLNSVVVTKIDFPEDLFKAVRALHQQHILSLEHIAEERRKFLSAQFDTETQRQYAEQIPGFSLPLLLRDNEEGKRQFLNNMLAAVNGVVTTSGSGTEGKTLVAAIVEALGQLSNATPLPPKPSNVDDVSQKVTLAADQTIREVLKGSSQTPIPLPERMASQGESATMLSPEVTNAMESCLADIPQVRIIAKGDSVVMIVTLSGARIRLTLRDWEDYPDAEPTIAKCVVLVGENEERVIKPELKSLTRWHPGSSLTDIARELIQRGAELTQG